MKTAIFLSALQLANAFPWTPAAPAEAHGLQRRDLFNSTSITGAFVSLLQSLEAVAETAVKSVSTKPAPTFGKFQGWKTYKANGVNLGGWLSLEKNMDPPFFNSNGASAAIDEDSFCKVLGKLKCGLLLESRYATYFTTKDIDIFAAGGINTLRIPVGYWAFMPAIKGDNYYTGSQLAYLSLISQYAITKYGMHIVVDLHGLPGGQNGLDNQGKANQLEWWHNTTHFTESLKLVDLATTFILGQANQDQFTLSLINEPLPALYYFGQTPDSFAYLNTFYNASLTQIRKRTKTVPVMLSDGFSGPVVWDQWWANSAQNIVFDVHIYFFVDGSYSYNAAYGACYLAKSYQNATNPAFVGEWSIQATLYNHLGNATDNSRSTFFQSQLSAYSTYMNGGSFWNGKHNGDVVVGTDGSTQPHYWSWQVLKQEGIVPAPGAQLISYC